ncbi:MAG: hypothetical protein Hyperionvirus9_28 [Hyperionvirus sp.]|uniref:Uncharacterized protein n=1 Tax=Hyperionvirus sp. TaxID=2487770 RepID=A0A3G5ABG1_9VIRU|nr:MAG: hypothetical protein Hyperionvirus9_28 [Hyperionvirus sp.]
MTKESKKSRKCSSQKSHASQETCLINVKNAKSLPSCKDAKMVDCKKGRTKEQRCVKNELVRTHNHHQICEIEVLHKQPSTSVHRVYRKYVVEHPNFHIDTKRCYSPKYLCSKEICKACCGNDNELF